ncbi:unnamed protein product [Ectocarpus sp. 12 AP-2014]
MQPMLRLQLANDTFPSSLANPFHLLRPILRAADSWPLDGVLRCSGREALVLDDGLRSTACCLPASQGSNWRGLASPFTPWGGYPRGSTEGVWLFCP